MRIPKIVLVEDNPADVFLVERALRDSGIPCEMTHFANGAEALQGLSATSAKGSVPDLIFLDLNTPMCDGFEVLSQLLNTPRLAGVPVAVLTSSKARQDRNRATILGARYIEKPSQLREFLTVIGQTVREMLENPRLSPDSPAGAHSGS